MRLLSSIAKKNEDLQLNKPKSTYIQHQIAIKTIKTERASHEIQKTMLYIGIFKKPDNSEFSLSTAKQLNSN